MASSSRTRLPIHCAPNSPAVSACRVYTIWIAFDLTASSTLHAPTQRAFRAFLRRLSDPVVVEAAGLYGHYLLEADNDLSKPIYSFTLYENTEDGALLRVQADNLNQPFDINKGAKLDMGSSAKLRTLITYLQLVAELHAQYAGLSRQAAQGQSGGQGPAYCSGPCSIWPTPATRV
jgi:hypothetical protein